MTKRRDEAEDEADDRTEADRSTTDTDGDRKTACDELGNRGVLRDVVADAEITGQHVFHIVEEAHDDGLIESVLRIQCGTLRIIQLLIIERRSRHQLHQDKEHQ